MRKVRLPIKVYYLKLIQVTRASLRSKEYAKAHEALIQFTRTRILKNIRNITMHV